MNTKNYEVHLEIFEGPLDLLLFLIKKNDLDIYDIPLSEITKEYLAYLDIMKDLNLDLCGDFLVMASTLMQIKAKTLLPNHDLEGEEGPDPRAELVNKLLEYQKFKEAAKFLDNRANEFKDVFYRNSPIFAEDEKHLTIDIFKLMATLREVLDNTTEGQYVVKGEEFPIEKKMEKILQLLSERTYISFKDIFKGETRRLAILSCFLAMLELIKLQKIFARQETHCSDILVYKKDPAAPPPPQQAGPSVTRPIWPTEDAPEPSATAVPSGAAGPASPGSGSDRASEPAAAAETQPVQDEAQSDEDDSQPVEDEAVIEIDVVLDHTASAAEARDALPSAEAMPSGSEPEREQDQASDESVKELDIPPGADEVIDAVPLTPHQDN